MSDKQEFKGLPHVRVEDFSDRDFLRIQEDVQRAEAHDHNVETGAYEEDFRGFDGRDEDNEPEDHSQLGLGVEQAVEESASQASDTEDSDETVQDGPAKDSPKDEKGQVAASTSKAKPVEKSK